MNASPQQGSSRPPVLGSSGNTPLQRPFLSCIPAGLFCPNRQNPCLLAFARRTNNSFVAGSARDGEGTGHVPIKDQVRLCINTVAGMSEVGRRKTPVIAAHETAQPQTPGPGRYYPEKAPPVTQLRPPSFSMGSRSKYRLVDHGPAPNSYTLPSLLGPRVPSKPSSPSFTISGRIKHGGFSEDLSRTPGPGHYNSTDPNTYLQRSPAFSMRGRHSMSRAAFRTPGPGTHSPEKVTAHRTRAPAYSLGIRHSDFVTPLIMDVSQ